MSTDEDMKPSFQFYTYPGTHFAGKPRYPTNFRLGHQAKTISISRQVAMMKSSELKDTRTMATGHRKASYEMKITNTTGNLEMRAVAIAKMERVKWNDRFWRTYLVCSPGCPPCRWSRGGGRKAANHRCRLMKT